MNNTSMINKSILVSTNLAQTIVKDSRISGDNEFFDTKSSFSKRADLTLNTTESHGEPQVKEYIQEIALSAKEYCVFRFIIVNIEISI